MRALVSTLLALICLLCAASAASGGERHVYRLTFNAVGLDGQHRTVLSRHDIFPEVSSLSPDREQLAYVPYFYDGARSNDLRIADVHSDGDRSLLRAPSWITDVVWAPNGRTIALTVGGQVRQPGVDGIWLVERDGTGFRRVADPGYALAWSPDSRSLAMTRLDARLRGFISVLSIETGVTRDLAAGFGPRWSPDGRSLLFEATAGRNELLKIRIVSASGGSPRSVARGVSPSWLPDGRHISFLRPHKSEPTSLWLVSSRGGRPTLLARRARVGIWSPTGHWIAYSSPGLAPCGTSLNLAPIRGGKTRRLVSASRQLSPMAWTHGGRRVLYVAEQCYDG